MSEYTVSDYGIFSNAITTVGNLNTELDKGKTSVNQCKTTLSNEAVFKGPACDSCLEALGIAESKVSGLSTNFSAIANYLKETSANYQAGDDKASQTVLGIDSNGNPSTTTAGNASTDNASRDQIYNYLASKGYPKAAIIGILSNIRSESNYNPTALGDNGTSYGLCQWHKGRWDNLKNYCAEKGLDSTTTEAQLDFLIYELETKYPNLNNYLKNVKNNQDGAYSAAYEMTVQFERPAGKEQSGEKRGNQAKDQLWQTYKDM